MPDKGKKMKSWRLSSLCAKAFSACRDAFSGTKKRYLIRLLPADAVFSAARGQSLLDAALAAKIAWPHRCRVGSCRRCRAKLLSGSVKRVADFSYTLSQQDLAAGMILACQSHIKGPVELMLPE
jgi:ferredoxin